MIKNKELLERGMIGIISKESLEKKLNSGKKLRIKYGADPTAPDLHLGHSVCLKKLKEFQNLGHQIVFIIGDFTAKIGDPSGKSKTRPMLSDAEIEKNTKTYFQQVGKILDLKKIEIHRNSEWFKKMNLKEILNLMSDFTVARILERDDFTKRLKAGEEISLHEILYPVMQAYDSIILKADVEIGGNDQIFNMLAGRDLQRKMNQPEQDIITLPLLIGLDGKEKMSKGLGNYVGVAEAPQEQFGKIMSIPDHLIIDYFKLTTNISLKEINQMEKEMRNGANPRGFKAMLAREIITLYHNKKSALIAEKEFDHIFKEKKQPSDIPAIKLKNKNYKIIDLLTETKLVKSKGEARRLIEQGGVKIDNKLIKDWQKEIKIKQGMIVQIGKRKFVKIN
ncbi:MAG: tyrosyl-tRNA synthetase [Parcubacteria group bacterium Athens1014_10]|nr:MAG: tyrosyl-tRNA synthetase [Parcubacteria group bacterium Athens1014_10]TSD05438.1 MAG: tyrosyl-tRNA synthetase [Parcubacteria group bacterium Athens0714_12]